MPKEVLLSNIGLLHTTKIGIERIKKNIDNYDPFLYCKNFILDKKCNISKRGKNYYCELNNIIITINSSSYTIITAHKIN